MVCFRHPQGFSDDVIAEPIQAFVLRAIASLVAELRWQYGLNVVVGIRDARADRERERDMERAVEHRNIRRYYVEAPTLFSWKNTDERVHTAEGTTRDISLQGLFVRAHECPPAGNHLTIEVLLPSLLRGRSGVLLKGDGVVLRVDQPHAGFAVAARLRSGSRDSGDLLVAFSEGCGRVQ